MSAPMCMADTHPLVGVQSEGHTCLSQCAGVQMQRSTCTITSVMHGIMPSSSHIDLCTMSQTTTLLGATAQKESQELQRTLRCMHRAANDRRRSHGPALYLPPCMRQAASAQRSQPRRQAWSACALVHQHSNLFPSTPRHHPNIAA